MRTGQRGLKSGRGMAVPALSAALLVPAAAARAGSSTPAGAVSAEAQAVSEPTRSTEWEKEARIPLDLDTFHTEGMTIVGEHVLISSVEIIESTGRHPEPVDGMDRRAGKGKVQLRRSGGRCGA